ncbi:MAG: hypothetical protein ACPGU1_14540 [Myxococcota bacterium]
MPSSTSLRAILLIAFIGLVLATVSACEESATTCTSELACANQDGLVETCCTELGEDNWSCTYVTPDGTEFACEAIVDEVNAGDYCEQAVEDLTAYCTD